MAFVLDDDNVDAVEAGLRLLCGHDGSEPLWALQKLEVGFRSGLHTVSGVDHNYGLWQLKSPHKRGLGWKRLNLAYAMKSIGAVILNRKQWSLQNLRLLEARGWEGAGNKWAKPGDFIMTSPPERVCTACPHYLGCLLSGKVVYDP